MRGSAGSLNEPDFFLYDLGRLRMPVRGCSKEIRPGSYEYLLRQSHGAPLRLCSLCDPLRYKLFPLVPLFPHAHTPNQTESSTIRG